MAANLTVTIGTGSLSFDPQNKDVSQGGTVTFTLGVGVVSAMITFNTPSYWGGTSSITLQGSGGNSSQDVPIANDCPLGARHFRVAVPAPSGQSLTSGGDPINGDVEVVTDPHEED